MLDHLNLDPNQTQLGLNDDGRLFLERVEHIPIYWATSYYVKPHKVAEYQRWLNSQEAKKLLERIEKESGFKHLNTYFTILGLGDYDCEDWSVAPDWASVDKGLVRASKGWEEWALKTWDLIDQTKPCSHGSCGRPAT